MSARTSLGAIAFIVMIARAVAPLPASTASADDACSILTPAEMSAVLGVSVGAGVYATPTYKKACTWKSTHYVAPGVANTSLVFQGLNTFPSGVEKSQLKSLSITPVSGVGDGAYYLAVGNNVGMLVKRGDVVFKVTVSGELPLAKKEAMENTLAQKVVSKL
jgi:hypothetical protein